MKEVSFCAFCSAPQHKILNYKDEFYFCRLCNHFFSVKPMELKCPKCDSIKIEDSEFPGSEGEVIFQCKSCKKMFPPKDLVEHNDIK